MRRLKWILILKPSYPPALRDKKVYLAGGVAAAFECKTTLRKSHVDEAIETAVEIQELARPELPRSTRYGTPYKALHGGILFGLLAHSHRWDASSVEGHVTSALKTGLRAANHPRDVLDVVCVADAGAWFAMRISYFGPRLNVWHLDQFREALPSGYASCTVFGPADPGDFAENEETFPDIPVGQLCAYVTTRLAWEDPSMRPLADYFRVVGLFGRGRGSVHPWPLETVYAPEVASRLQAGGVEPEPWSEWRIAFG